MQIAVIIPALNEASNISELVKETLAQPIHRVIVVDNGSTDGTDEMARRAGAEVVTEPRRGYGFACAAGVAAADADALVFMDGDHSFLPSQLPLVIAPLMEGRADLALGSRVLGHIARGAMLPQQKFGNALAAALMRWLYGLSVTDLGPFRAIRRETLLAFNMQEMTFGWPTEMTVKAARRHLRVVEVPVSYHPRRAGQSKVSGTVQGTLLAGYHILNVIFRYAVSNW